MSSALAMLSENTATNATTNAIPIDFLIRTPPLKMITKVNPVLPDQQKRGTYICFCFRVRFSRLPSATSVIGILINSAGYLFLARSPFTYVVSEFIILLAVCQHKKPV
jgi:hypothetical protein